MDDFTNILRKGTMIFKGSSESQIQGKLNQHCWFAFSKQNAEVYATNIPLDEKAFIYIYELTQDIKVIDITSIKFKIDFWDKCNKSYHPLNTEKASVLIPLGIPGYESQKILVNNQQECSPNIMVFGNLMGGHRCSSPITDRDMTKALETIYGDQVVGYVQQVDVPSCFHGGLFASELCIFNCNEKVRQLEKLEYKRQTANMTGGADAVIARENYVGDDWNEFMKRFIKATGYKGKVRYDSNGKIERISFEDIMKDREIQILKQSKKEYAKLKKLYKVSK